MKSKSKLKLTKVYLKHAKNRQNKWEKKAGEKKLESVSSFDLPMLYLPFYQEFVSEFLAKWKKETLRPLRMCYKRVF